MLRIKTNEPIVDDIISVSMPIQGPFGQVRHRGYTCCHKERTYKSPESKIFPLSTREPQEALSLPRSIEKKMPGIIIFLTLVTVHPKRNHDQRSVRCRDINDSAIIVEQTRMRDYDKSTIEPLLGIYCTVGANSIPVGGWTGARVCSSDQSRSDHGNKNISGNTLVWLSSRTACTEGAIFLPRSSLTRDENQ